MRSTKITAVTIGLASALTLAACGSPTSSGSSTGSGALPSAATGAALKGQTLTVWVSNTLSPGYKSLFKDFEKKTGATVKTVVFPDPYESNLMTKWATGARPDLMVFQSANQWLVKLNPAKNLFDLSGQDFIAKQKFGQDKYATVVNGKHYGLSLDTPSVFGLWYNKELFAKWGISAPTNFAQLQQVCTAIKKKDSSVSPLFDVGGDQWPTQVLPFMLWADAMKSGLQDKLNTNKAKWTDSAIVNSLKDYQQLIKNGCFNKDLKTATYAQQEAAFTGGKTAMIAQGTWVSADFVKQVGLAKMNKTMGWTSLSTTNDDAAWATTFSLQMPKTGNTKKEAAALALLKYASGDGYQAFVNTQNQAAALDGFTTPKTVPDALNDAYAALQDSSKSSPQLFVADYGTFTTSMSEMINGSKTPEQVAQEMQAAWTKSAKALGLAGF